MKKALLILTFAAVLVVGFAATSAMAQSSDEPRRIEVFGGYSYQRADKDDDNSNTGANITNLNDQTRDLHGFNASTAGYFAKNFGVVGDFSAHFRKRDVTTGVAGTNFTTEIKRQSYNIMGGPQVRFVNKSRVTPFARAMAGVQVNRIELGNFRVAGSNQNSNFDDTTTNFALAFGGGVDVNVSRRIAVRAVQFDYIPVFERDRDNFLGTGVTRNGETRHTFRFSTGIVFK